MRDGAIGEVVAVGSELLLGEYPDSNSAEVSARLAEVGVDVRRHTAVGDHVSDIAAVLQEACSRAAVVVVTGGLGPTQDDLTRQAVAAVAGVELQRRPELVEVIEEVFASRGRPMPASNLVQADLPAGARAIAPVGTAPGFRVEVAGSIVYCVPGVPWEMRAMLASDVVPDVIARFGARATVTRVVRTSGMAEAAVAEACQPLVARLAEEGGNPELAWLASRGETRVKVIGRAASREEALAACEPVVAELVALLGPAVAGLDDEGVEASVARLLRSLGWTLGVAESITAGGVGARLVRVPGASEWFRGGLVTYMTPVKASVAGVDAALLEAHGPVSEPVVAALASGARARLSADVGLGVVGVAGPDPQGGQPVGTLGVAVALPDGSLRSRMLRLPGQDRVTVQEFAASTALDYLRRRLAQAAT